MARKREFTEFYYGTKVIKNLILGYLEKYSNTISLLHLFVNQYLCFYPF